MKATMHSVIVKVDKRINDEISMGKTKLYLNGEYDLYKNIKICGEVVSSPKKLNGTVLYGKREGFPPYSGKKDKMGNYNPTPHQHEYVTMVDSPIETKSGDTVYFHYLTLSASTYLGRDDEGLELYRCAYDQIFCIVREGEIRMVNGWVAVTPLQDDSYQEVEIDELDIFNRKIGTRTERVKMNESGIIYDMNDEPIFRHGTLSMRGVAPDHKDYEVAVGDTLIYSDFSEFKNTIEGKEYYLMKLWDVVAVYKGVEILPIGDYVLLDATEAPQTKLILPDKYNRKADTGGVLSVGTGVEDIQPLQTVHFHGSRAFYVPVGEKRLCFITYQNIWGVEINEVA